MFIYMAVRSCYRAWRGEGGREKERIVKLGVENFYSKRILYMEYKEF